MVIREAKKRREAEEAYAAAGRIELADKEHAESAVLADYLPQPARRCGDQRQSWPGAIVEHRCGGARRQGDGQGDGPGQPPDQGQGRWG